MRRRRLARLTGSTPSSVTCSASTPSPTPSIETASPRLSALDTQAGTPQIVAPTDSLPSTPRGGVPGSQSTNTSSKLCNESLLTASHYCMNKKIRNLTFKLFFL